MIIVHPDIRQGQAPIIFQALTTVLQVQVVIVAIVIEIKQFQMQLDKFDPWDSQMRMVG